MKLLVPLAGIVALVAYANDAIDVTAIPPWLMVLPVTSAVIIGVLISSSR